MCLHLLMYFKGYWLNLKQILVFFPDKPRIDIGAVKDIVVKAGEEFSITIPFTGFPKPEATWTKNDKDIDDKDARIFMKVITAVNILH